MRWSHITQYKSSSKLNIEQSFLLHFHMPKKKLIHTHQIILVGTCKQKFIREVNYYNILEVHNVSIRPQFHAVISNALKELSRTFTNQITNPCLSIHIHIEYFYLFIINTFNHHCFRHFS